MKMAALLPESTLALQENVLKLHDQQRTASGLLDMAMMGCVHSKTCKIVCYGLVLTYL